jgi:hypothetical protein
MISMLTKKNVDIYLDPVCLYSSELTWKYPLKLALTYLPVDIQGPVGLPTRNTHQDGI